MHTNIAGYLTKFDLTISVCIEHILLACLCLNMTSNDIERQLNYVTQFWVMLPLAARKLLCYGYRHVCKMLNANKDELELELGCMFWMQTFTGRLI
jgi:hypothetical protein